VRVLRDSMLLSNADRSELAPYGVNGGLAGRPYGISVEDAEGNVRPLPGMVDDVPVRAGEVVRVWTSGGGGWGDPLEREPELVAYDVRCGLVSREAAEADYGVVLSDDPDPDVTVDVEATEALRERLRRDRGALPMFDRGEHYRKVRSEGAIVWPEGWDDPDDWPAVPVDLSPTAAT